MSLPNDLSRCLTEFDPHTTLIAVVELSLSSWLVAGMVPGMERNPLKKMEPDEAELLRLIEKWREEAIKADSTINRVAVAFEAGRDGFWLARWLRARGIEAHVIHSSSRGITRASQGQDGSARHGAVDARLCRLVAW